MSGEMEFEFVQGKDSFVATDKVVTFLRNHLAKGEVQVAARLYEDSGSTCAPELLREAQSASSTTQKAIAEMFVLARDFKSAGAVFELSRVLDRAAHFYEQGMELESAARCYEKCADLPRAGACLERAGKVEQAVALYKKAGPSQALAEALCRQGHYFDAASVYRAVFNLKAEIEMLRLVPMQQESRVPATLRLAELLDQYNYPDQAVGLLIETVKGCEHARLHQPMYMLLVRILEKMGRTAEAAQVRARVQNLLTAGSGPPGASVAMPGPPPSNPANVATQTAPSAVRAPAPAAAPPAGLPTFTATPLAPALTLGAAPVPVAAGAPVAPASPAQAPRDPFGSIVNPVTGQQGLGSTGGEAYAHLKAIPIFAELGAQDMRELYRSCDDLQFSNGETLIEQGVAGRGLFILVQGDVHVLRVDGGATKELARLAPGQWFGELSLLDESPTSARVVAQGAAFCLFISRARFLEYLATHPEAALRIYRLFSRTLADRLRDANARR